jgi:hypothetical protein
MLELTPLLLTKTQDLLNLREGEFDMWVSDAPTQTMEPPAIYMAAKEAASSPAKIAHELGVCSVVSRSRTDVSPTFDANRYVGRYIRNAMNFIRNADGSPRLDISLRIIKQPEHGELVQRYPDATGYDQYYYEYIPNEVEDYVGNDYFVMDVSAGGITVEIYYTMSVDVGQPSNLFDENNKLIPDPTRCPKPNGEMWKISTTPDTPWTAQPSRPC